MRGFRYWEFDIRESSDGIVFVFHDDTIDVGGNTPRPHRYHSRRSRGRVRRGISIPLFSEVCEELDDSPEMVMVEIKHLSSEEPGPRSWKLSGAEATGRQWRPREVLPHIPVRYQGRLGARFRSPGWSLLESVATG